MSYRFVGGVALRWVRGWLAGRRSSGLPVALRQDSYALGSRRKVSRIGRRVFCARANSTGQGEKGTIGEDHPARRFWLGHDLLG